MEMQQIRHFVAVARNGSFRRAAEELHITQPALTRSIRNLEERVQSALLARNARGVIPTLAGEVFLEFAQQTLNDNSRILDRLQQMQGAVPGELRIGVSANFSHPALARTLAELSRKKPERRITICEEFLSDLVPKLIRSNLDMLVTLAPDGFAHPELIVKPLVTVGGCIICGSGHPLARRRSVTMDDLREAQWIMLGLDEDERYFERRFSAHGVAAPRIALRTSSTSLLKQLLCQLQLLALVPAHLVAAEVAEGNLKVISTPLGDFQAQGAVIYQKRLRGLLDIDAFVQRFRTAYRALDKPIPRRIHGRTTNPSLRER